MSNAQRPRVVAARIPTRDGFTLSATYRAGQPVIYSGVSITYRPALQVQAQEFLDDPRKYVVKARELAAKHVTGWNVAGDDPDTVAPVSLDTVTELAYPVLDWMVNCITGYAPQTEAEDAKN